MSAPLRLYEDAALTQIVSVNASFNNPDDESNLSGTNGQVAEAPLWVAPEQTKLDGGIDDTQTAITLVAARFADTDYSVIIFPTGEKALITGGHGTKNLTVIRGWDGTTPAAHSDGDAVIAAYNFSDITIDCIDNQGTDESDLMLYCDDDGGSPDESWEAPHSIGSLNYNESKKIWRQLTVEAGTATENKHDLQHVFTFGMEEEGC